MVQFRTIHRKPLQPCTRTAAEEEQGGFLSRSGAAGVCANPEAGGVFLFELSVSPCVFSLVVFVLRLSLSRFSIKKKMKTGWYSIVFWPAGG